MKYATVLKSTLFHQLNTSAILFGLLHIEVCVHAHDAPAPPEPGSGETHFCCISRARHEHPFCTRELGQLPTPDNQTNQGRTTGTWTGVIQPTNQAPKWPTV